MPFNVKKKKKKTQAKVRHCLKEEEKNIYITWIFAPLFAMINVLY